MKFVFLIGGFVGFTLAAATGVGAGRESGLVLRDAAVGCVVGALLFRWFWSVLVKAIAETVEHRRREARLAAEPKPAPATPASAAARSR
jgi:divalent metal cation (Fe/Co/Zn/Cd) transporter